MLKVDMVIFRTASPPRHRERSVAISARQDAGLSIV